ncbi:MAG: hypothetical protein Q9212_004594 [Teloschistes hypoglaucus]
MFRIAHWTASGGKLNVIAWLLACLALTVVLLIPLPVTTKVRNNGFYEPVPYKDWRYPYDARNRHENQPSKGLSSHPLIGQIERTSEPNYLCLADGMKIIKVKEWRKENGTNIPLRYIMVSYTGAQFTTEEDKYSLHAIGQHSAIAAGVKAYWLSCSCLGSESEREENVWRISDVVRGAHHLVIALAGSVGVEEDGKTPNRLLHDWGNRVWTLPELLLSPEGDDIRIYTLNRSLNRRVQLVNCLSTNPSRIHRRNFARFWDHRDDDTVVGQLLDHYEGSVVLSNLELMSTALKCLQRRHTIEHLPGDLSYSLMGLLRQRPDARKGDSGFQAFARLSLANDSNMLLERLICLFPPDPYAPWYSFEDQWDARLWDVYPRTQVCGIGDDDTVILDGARAATIRWKSFKKVMLRGNRTVIRLIAVIAPSTVGSLIISGSLLLAFGNPVGAVPLTFALIILLLSPWLINRSYLGKVWSAQPYFFGIEGYVPLHTIEKKLFGANLDRLSWSPTASPLSKHNLSNRAHFENYCEGQDPKSDPGVNARIQKALQSTASQEKIFTLVDTYTMTVTLFAAVRPPVAVLACGEEGGMQRALLCSYDWTNNTLYRESVLRIETPAYWKMSPIRRVRLSLQTRPKVD